MARKLGRTAEERMAIIRNQASELLWYGSIETTVDRAKEVRSYAESMLTLAINTYEDTVKVTKTVKNEKNETTVLESLLQEESLWEALETLKNSKLTERRSPISR